ncbi:hypothetical protein OEZ86_006849 [Tetradesmus obliquus]|nr:hypothetical protein OEZ86_006849 [Tetradesmus obliquus]
MCVNVASRRLVEAAAKQGRLGLGLFPEHRLTFVINTEGSVLLVDTATNSDTNSSSSSSSSSSNSSAIVRRGLPHWLGVELPVISPAEAAALLEDQLWFEPFGRADAGKLLEIGCDAKDLLAPSLVAKPGQVHPTEVAQLITFRSPQQAAARSALLAALTYDPMVPTDTLAAACSDSSQQQQICMDGYGSVQFQTHMFYKLPHLATLAAAAAAAADEDSSAEAATCSGASGPLTAAPADAVGDAELQACAAVHGPGSSAGDGGIAGGSVTALAASAAEYIQQLKLAEVG